MEAAKTLHFETDFRSCNGFSLQDNLAVAIMSKLTAGDDLDYATKLPFDEMATNSRLSELRIKETFFREEYRIIACFRPLNALKCVFAFLTQKRNINRGENILRTWRSNIEPAAAVLSRAQPVFVSSTHFGAVLPELFRDCLTSGIISNANEDGKTAFLTDVSLPRGFDCAPVLDSGRNIIGILIEGGDGHRGDGGGHPHREL